MASESNVDDCYFISAGKFRRYHGDGWRQWLDLKTQALNAKDFFQFLRGCFQSYRLMGKLRPDVVMVKGGFVGVPVGLAAAAKKIPFLTHDSDALPGLANRMIARWATLHAVAMPADVYKNYPKDKIVTTGIPLNPEFRRVTKDVQKAAKIKLGISGFDKVLLLTGGGLGALRLNEMLVKLAPDLLSKFPDLVILHIAGERQKDKVDRAYHDSLPAADLERVHTFGYTKQMADISASSDVIITRAGATTIAELAVMSKACIVVPSAQLSGGHQLENAKILADTDSAIIITDENELERDLKKSIEELLTSPKRRAEYAQHISKLANPNAARALADLLIKIVNPKDR